MHQTETRAPLASMERLRNWCGYLRAAPLYWSAWLDSAPRTPTGARWLGTRLPEPLSGSARKRRIFEDSADMSPRYCRLTSLDSQNTGTTQPQTPRFLQAGSVRMRGSVSGSRAQNGASQE